MADVENISVAITAQQAELLRDAVNSGEYATANDVVREAMQAWQDRWEARQMDAVQLRKLWDEGKASGRAGPVDLEDVRKEARRRLSEASAGGR